MTNIHKTTVYVEAASCNKKQEPLLLRKKEQCSPIEADGRDDGRVEEYIINTID